jgi:hypothetical protein
MGWTNLFTKWDEPPSRIPEKLAGHYKWTSCDVQTLRRRQTNPMFKHQFAITNAILGVYPIFRQAKYIIFFKLLALFIYVSISIYPVISCITTNMVISFQTLFITHKQWWWPYIRATAFSDIPIGDFVLCIYIYVCMHTYIYPAWGRLKMGIIVYCRYIWCRYMIYILMVRYMYIYSIHIHISCMSWWCPHGNNSPS